MPTRDNTQLVHLSIELTRIFRQKWEQAKKQDPTIKIGTIINEYLRKALYYEEQMELANEHLEYIKPVDDKLLFYDKDKKVFAMIEVRGPGTLFCEEDNSDNCRHVGFAWTKPEVYKKLIEHGFKKPKVA